ncbi:MAG: hypothetical protein K0S37_1875 [Microbacterium sp.]|jgi:hypothetical protein|nr:hypothetical protein [Microbacterium sp.]
MTRGLFALSAVALLMLTGCTSATPQADPTDNAPTPSAVATTPAPTSSAGATASPSPLKDSATFIAELQPLLADYGVDLSNEQIETAVAYTCSQKAAGADRISIQALPADSPALAEETIPGRANEVIVNMSWDFFCPSSEN